jgi:hypothetical protein
VKLSKIIQTVCMINCFFFMSFSMPQVSGGNYQEDLVEEGKKLVKFIERVKSLHIQLGDASLKSLESKTRFRLSSEKLPNAWVIRDPNSDTATIYMTAEYRLLITYLADADVISFTTPKFFHCREGYVSALFRSLAAIQQSSVSGSASRRLLAPEVYLETASSDCSKFKSKFPIDQQYRFERDKAVDRVVVLGYLHELGHIALGHSAVSLSAIDSLPTSTLRLREFIRLMSRSRAQESAADDWAIDRFVDLSPTPLEAFSNVLSTFYLTFGGVNCSLESADSHPNGFQRFARQMGRLKERATKAGKFPSNKDLAKIIDDTTSVAAKAQLSLKCPS